MQAPLCSSTIASSWLPPTQTLLHLMSLNPLQSQYRTSSLAKTVKAASLSVTTTRITLLLATSTPRKKNGTRARCCPNWSEIGTRHSTRPVQTQTCSTLCPHLGSKWKTSLAKASLWLSASLMIVWSFQRQRKAIQATMSCNRCRPFPTVRWPEFAPPSNQSKHPTIDTICTSISNRWVKRFQSLPPVAWIRRYNIRKNWSRANWAFCHLEDCSLIHPRSHCRQRYTKSTKQFHLRVRAPSTLLSKRHIRQRQALWWIHSAVS